MHANMHLNCQKYELKTLKYALKNSIYIKHQTCKNLHQVLTKKGDFIKKNICYQIMLTTKIFEKFFSYYIFFTYGLN